jgi:hypothetical protein
VKEVHARAFNADLVANPDFYWGIYGLWTASSVQPPSITSVSPLNGNGSSAVFTAVYTDAAGSGDLSEIRLLFNSTSQEAGGCSMVYFRASNTLYLRDDAGIGYAGSVTPGGAGVAANNQCTIMSGGSYSTTANTFTLPVSVTFKTWAFSGTKNVYGAATGASSGSSGWVLAGTWKPL